MSRALTTSPIFVGRSPTNDLAMAVPAVSSRHAAVWTSGGKVFVEDLGSRNGTTIRERRVQKIRQAAPGDEIVLGGAVRLRVERDETQPAPSPGDVRLVEDVRTGVRIAMRGDRFRIGPRPDDDLCVDEVAADGEPADATLVVDPDGVVWLGAADGSLTAIEIGDVFDVGARSLRIVVAPVGHSATVEAATTQYPYTLRAELSGPTGPRALVACTRSGIEVAFTGPSRAVLMYLLARQVVADRAAGIAAPDCGWASDAAVAGDLWGRSGGERTLNVLVTRIRNDLRKAGLDPWFLEKRQGYVRVRLDDVGVT